MFSKAQVVACFFTIVGLTGLVISPLVGANAAVKNPNGRLIAIAISAGPNLALDVQADVDARRSRRATHVAAVQAELDAQRMVCGRVIRLQFADVGLGCRKAHEGSEIVRVD